MKLLSIRARNFRCFEELDLDLNVDGLVAVVGPNGAGKSTLFSAIEWALYGGRRGRGTLPVRRDGCADGEPCFVEVDFEVAGRAYRVSRADKKGAHLLDLATGDSISTTLDETSRQVAARLGLTRDMFLGTFYARQREVNALDSKDEQKRRGQVELLLGIERLRRAVSFAQTAVKEQQHLVTALESGAPDIDAVRGEADRVQREADEAAPVVQAATERAGVARASRDAARTQLDALRARERDMLARRNHAQTAQAKADQACQARDALRQRVTDAENAETELAALAPVAAEAERLSVSDRQMERALADHERADELRKHERTALTVAAGLADQMAELSRAHEEVHRTEDLAAGPPLPLREQIEAAEQRIDLLRGSQSERAQHRGASEQRIETLRLRLMRAERAEQLDHGLEEQPEAELALEAALARWHELNAQRTQLAEAIIHDTEHRDAVLAGTETAACPTCKRPYGTGELDQIVAGYERDLEAAAEQLAAFDAELAELKTAGASARAKAQHLRKLAAERQALGTDLPAGEAIDRLRDKITGIEDDARSENEIEARAEAELAQLIAELPALRSQERAAEQQRRQIADLEGQRVQAEREARSYAEQLAKLGSNGYDPDVHTLLRTRLAEAQAASQECAVLRGKSDGLELLRRRLAEQEQAANDAAVEEAQLSAAAAEVVVEESALQQAENERAAADRELDAAQSALAEANRRATADAAAVGAALARLADAQERAGQLNDQRRELRVRGEVADALSAFREDASRRARPTLERETGLLLGQITRGRYSAVELSDSYHLEIADGQRLHPIERYSGGEQDLAGLCLRLALSRTLARQRGAETGFVLLDEIFGSQDRERRRALLEQLHAIGESEFRQVFVVSHTDDVVQHCDLTIEITRDDNGVSTAAGPRR